jgi:hypothetical protein
MRAEQLWREIQTLSLETSTLGDVQKLVERYGGEHRVTGTLQQGGAFACTSPHCELVSIKAKPLAAPAVAKCEISVSVKSLATVFREVDRSRG